MRILPDPEKPVLFQSASVPTPVAAAPAQADLERIAALERTVQTMTAKIEDLKSVVRTLQDSQKAMKAERPITLTVAPVAEVKPIPVMQTNLEVDAEALKKNLLSKMWKYLNDDQPAKAI